MNTIRKIKKNTKALSPVVASIILIAVTVAVSIAVAAWMGALVIGQMNTEELKITNVQFATVADTSQTITISVSNTGTSSVTVSSVTMAPATTSVTPSYPTGFTETSTLPANTPGTIQLSIAADSGLYNNGDSYQFTILTSAGNKFTYTASAPN